MKKIILPLMLLACFSGAFAQNIFFDGFEDGLNWTLIDGDGDNFNWTLNTTPQQIAVASGEACVYSQSWTQETNALNPNNYMISPAIAMPADASSVLLEWKAYGQDQNYANEHFEVIVATAPTKEAVDAGTILFDGVVGTSEGFKSFGASLAAFSGQTIHIAFVHNEVSDQFMLNIDDVRVFSATNLDASLAKLDMASFALVNSELPVKLEVKNEGVSAITSLELSYQASGAAAISQTFDGLNIATGGTETLTFTTPYTVSENNTTITASIIKVNGQSDDVADNNTASKQVASMTELVKKNILIEEGTGTWCGFCPRGAIGLDSITKQYDNVIGIAVHSGDVMAVEGYDQGLAFQGLPSATANRTTPVDPAYQELIAVYQAQKDDIAPVSLTADAKYDPTSKKVTVDVTTKLHVASLAGDYRINVILTEDGVTGTGSEYAQANYYAGGANGPMGGFENLPDPVPADQMVYNHVARVMMGGFDGDANSFPSSVSNSETPRHQYVSDIDPSWDVSKMHAVAVFIDKSNGAILNSTSVKVSSPVNVQELDANNILSIAPNPAYETTTVKLSLDEAAPVQISIFNAVGQQVAQKNYGQISGIASLPVDVSNLLTGTYTLQIKAGNAISNQKIIIAK